MPGGKRRLKFLFTTGIQVGANGQSLKSILTGSVSVTAPAFNAGDAASTDTASATIANLTASHLLLAMPDQAMSGCITLVSACPGAGAASFTFATIAGSGGGTATAKATIVRYIAAQLL